jgi:hypothetical protein
MVNSCSGVRPSPWYVGNYLAHCTSPGWWKMMSVEQSVEWLAEEIEVYGENLAQCHFVHHKPHMFWPAIESRPPRWCSRRLNAWATAQPKHFLCPVRILLGNNCLDCSIHFKVYKIKKVFRFWIRANSRIWYKPEGRGFDTRWGDS